MAGAEELYEILASDGMLVKRPILTNGQQVLVGFKEKEWKQRGLARKVRGIIISVHNVSRG